MPSLLCGHIRRAGRQFLPPQGGEGSWGGASGHLQRVEATWWSHRQPRESTSIACGRVVLRGIPDVLLRVGDHAGGSCDVGRQRFQGPKHSGFGSGLRFHSGFGSGFGSELGVKRTRALASLWLPLAP